MHDLSVPWYTQWFVRWILAILGFVVTVVGTCLLYVLLSDPPQDLSGATEVVMALFGGVLAGVFGFIATIWLTRPRRWMKKQAKRAAYSGHSFT